jgi:uncharacterized damage-inducible protein DinB
MLKETLIEIFERDLNKLKIEINSYSDESELWIIEKNIKNSGGNLCLHLLGNLNQFICGILGKNGYVRNRDAEFNDKNISKKILIKNIDNTVKGIAETFQSMSDKDFDLTYPIDVFNKKMTTGFFLIHLATHLNYHLGQINYHRRIIGS